MPAKIRGIQPIPLTPKTEKSAELSGTVLDRNGKPIQGAMVSLDDMPGMKPAETSTDGIFTIKDIPKPYGERARIRVVNDGYQLHTEDVVLGKSPPIIKLTRKK